MDVDKNTTLALIKKVKPWVAVVALVLVAAIGYGGYTGLQYRALSAEEADLHGSIAAHGRVLAVEVTGDETAFSEELAQETARLQASIDRFADPVSPGLLTLIANAAEASGLQPRSLAGSGSSGATVAGLDFSTDGVAISLTGDIENLPLFLDRLRSGFPGATLEDLRVLGLDSTPSIQTEIVIHHSPRQRETETTPQ